MCPVAWQSLAFSPVSKPHTHITYMLRQCTSIVYILDIIICQRQRALVRDLGSPLRFMLRRSSLVECVSVLHGMCLQCVNFFLSISKTVCAAMFVKKS
jgi:hypothetical protein